MDILNKHLKSNNKPINETRNYLYEYMFEVINNNKNKLAIPGWDGDIANEMGSVEWNSNDQRYIVYSTPFLDNSEGIDIDIQDIEEDETKSLKTINMNITGNERKDFNTYMKIMKSVLKSIK